MEQAAVHRDIRAAWLGRAEYRAAWDLQVQLVREVDEGTRGDTLLMLEHPPTYTIGSQKHPEHLLFSREELAERGIALFEIDRGGDITYHGPGQLVGYPIIRLEGPGIDLHGYLRDLEEAIIRYLASRGIAAERKPTYTGVWVGDRKIAAIGVKANRSRRRKGYVTSHGFAFNIKAGIEQEGFAGIIPCGISEYGVTSLEECLGQPMTVQEAAAELLPYWAEVFRYPAAVLSQLKEEEAWTR